MIGLVDHKCRFFHLLCAGDLCAEKDFCLRNVRWVITVAIGRSMDFRVSMASSLIRFAPLVATITGSTTIFSA